MSAEDYDRLLRPNHEPDLSIRTALRSLNQLELSTAYPFLLKVFSAYRSETISKGDLLDLLGILENYLVRRHICGEPANFLNKMFPTLWRDIQVELENAVSFKEALRLALANRRYPNDRNVEQAIRIHKQYDARSQKKLCLILESINRHLHEGSDGYTVLDGSPTIEHILPQTPDPSWKKNLGEAFENTYREYLHTPGNLTLVTQDWNVQLSNGSFSLKKEKLANHVLKINNSYFTKEIDVWDEAAILERAEQLAQAFMIIWPCFGEATAVAKEAYRSPRSVTVLGELLPSAKVASHQTSA